MFPKALSFRKSLEIELKEYLLITTSDHIIYLMDKKNKHLLSRGKMVMNKILSKTGLTEDQVIALDSTRRNQVFETTFFV
jgi:hypothetical protein